MRIHIIRHGETKKNTIKLNDVLCKEICKKNAELNNNGYMQCIKVAEYFNDCKKIDIYTSSVLRAVQTSNYIKCILDKKNIEVKLHINDILYDNEKTIKKTLILKQFINIIYKKYYNCDTTIIFITHNHIIDLFNKMINGIYSPKTKYYNGSITIVDINTELNEYIFTEDNINIIFNNIGHLRENVNTDCV
jgi:broad specificity phosphatase PhoE